MGNSRSWIALGAVLSLFSCSESVVGFRGTCEAGRADCAPVAEFAQALMDEDDRLADLLDQTRVAPPVPAFAGDVVEVREKLGPVAQRATLFKDGRWTGSISIPLAPSQETVDAANALALYLSQMSGVTLSVQEGTSGPGILVGTYAEWKPTYPLAGKLERADEDYVLLSGINSIALFGKTGAQVVKGAWHLLELAGYRQFMPSPVWEVVPSYRKMRFLVSLREPVRFDRLSFAYNACGIMPDLQDSIDDWEAKNRLGTTGAFTSGHVWGDIIAENADVFAANQHYASSAGNKLCVFEPEVQAMVIKYVKDRLSADPNKIAQSISAADGNTGWDEICPGTMEQRDYTPSDRQAHLAKVVAEALRTGPAFAGKKVAYQAYGATSYAPTHPSITIDQDVIIVVTKGYIEGGRTIEQVYQEYAAKGARNIGPYEYLNVFEWTRDRVGQSRGSRPSYWAQTVQETLDYGVGDVRFYVSETSDSMTILDGLGSWVIGRLLMRDRTDGIPEEIDRLQSEFYKAAFGEVLAPEMAEFYDLVDGDPYLPLISMDLIHKMYGRLQAARAKTTDPKILARLDELVLYTRYTELRRLYDTAPTETKVDAYDAMMAHVNRIWRTHLVHYRCFFADAQSAPHLDELEDRYGILEIKWSNSIHGSPWPGTPFTATEIDSIVTQGILNNPELPFATKSFSGDLVNPSAFDADKVSKGNASYWISNQSWYLWIKDGQTAFNFDAQSGRAYDYKGGTTINVVEVATGTTVSTLVVPPDNVMRSCSLPVADSGLYRLDFFDKAGFYLTWNSDDYSITVVQSEIEAPSFHGRYDLYFYVPKGTTVLGGYSQKFDAYIEDPNGVQHRWTAAQSYFNIPIPPGTDGKLWKINECMGDCYLLTVPPQSARNAKDLLLPREVVEADQL